MATRNPPETPRDRRPPTPLPPDADLCVDEWLALAEWLRDRRGPEAEPRP
jgi:hypothetical protein